MGRSPSLVVSHIRRTFRVVAELLANEVYEMDVVLGGCEVDRRHSVGLLWLEEMRSSVGEVGDYFKVVLCRLACRPEQRCPAFLISVVINNLVKVRQRAQCLKGFQVVFDSAVMQK